MADPLSVAACIAGLLSLAGQLYTTLDQIVTKTQDTPSFANSVLVEVGSFKDSLSALQTLFSAPSFPSQRAALVPGDFIVLACTDAALLFSELECEVAKLTASHKDDLWSKARWLQKRGKLETLVTRLQWQKMTLTLQLNVLKAASEQEARVDLALLVSSCMEKLADNKDLAERLNRVESQVQQRQSILVETSSVLLDEGSCLRPDSQCARDSVILDNLAQHPFEEALLSSWVYQRNRDRPQSLSMRSSVIRHSAWSILSGISLAQLSAISIICLPIQRSELFNAEWYPLEEVEHYEDELLQTKSHEQTGPPACGHDCGADTALAVSQSRDPSAELEEPAGVRSSSSTPIDEGIAGFQSSEPSPQTSLKPSLTTPGSNSQVRSPAERKLLVEALRRAHSAVRLDTTYHHVQAIEAYEATLKELLQVYRMSEIADDRTKLLSIYTTYSNRIKELLDAVPEGAHCGHAQSCDLCTLSARKSRFSSSVEALPSVPASVDTS